MSIASIGAANWEKARSRPARVAHSVPEVATMLGVSQASIWRAIRRGQLRAVRLGGRTLIVAASIDNLLTATWCGSGP
jgi:excisionase family DNA binding protein